jgi:hypothetical protein
MKKLLFEFSIILLLATGCNSSKQVSNQLPAAQSTNSTPTSSSISIPVIPDLTMGWNIYTDPTYGFQIKLPPDYKFMGEMVQNSTGALVLTPENQQFNNAIKSSTANLTLRVTEFNKLPKTQQEACDQEKANGGQSYDAKGKPIPFVCALRNISQAELSAFGELLKNAKVGQLMSLPMVANSFNADSGTVVNLNGTNGLLVVTRNRQDVGSTVSVYWFDKFSNLLQIYQELSSPSVAEATQTPEYKTFLIIATTFKFNPTSAQDPEASWKDDVYNQFKSLTDWQEQNLSDWSFADYTYESQRRGQLKQYDAGNIILLSKSFNENGFANFEDNQKAYTNEKVLEHSIRKVLSDNGWVSIAWPTEPGFYTDFLYVKDNHPLDFQVGTRDAVDGGEFISIEFQY